MAWLDHRAIFMDALKAKAEEFNWIAPIGLRNPDQLTPNRALRSCPAETRKRNS